MAVAVQLIYLEMLAEWFILSLHKDCLSSSLVELPAMFMFVLETAESATHKLKFSVVRCSRLSFKFGYYTKSRLLM